jgi:hypothetical protein
MIGVDGVKDSIMLKDNWTFKAKPMKQHLDMFKVFILSIQSEKLRAIFTLG